MGSIRRSWKLVKASWTTLKADRELLSLPLMSGVIALLVAAVFLGLVYLVDYDPVTGIDGFELSPVGTILLVLLGIATAITATFFQAAMVGGAHERLTGGDPTVGSALAMARSRVGVIIPWAIFSWTIGAVLRAIEERAGAVGRFIVGMLGMAFRVVTFLAVPVLVFEQLGPIDTLKRSATLFKSTWGENLVGNAGIGIISFIALIPGVLVGALLTAASPFLGIPVIVLWVVLVMVVSTSLTAIYQTALYHYVVTNEIPAAFEEANLATSFRRK